LNLGINYLPSHQIRFTLATNLIEAGVPINQLSNELGHTQVRTTFMYTRQREADAHSKGLIAQVQDI
jgi:site-specific recombinase XerD